MNGLPDLSTLMGALSDGTDPQRKIVGHGAICGADPFCEGECMRQPQTDVRLAALLIDPATIDSVALRRIVEEVRNPAPSGHGAYDRVHNRHNRSGSPYVPIVPLYDRPVPPPPQKPS